MMEIKPLQREHVPFLNSVRNECSKEYLHDSRQFSLEDTYKWFDITKPDFYIVLLDGVSIGYFRISNYSETNKNIYIGMDLHKDYRGKGHSFNAYVKFIPFILNKYNLNKISLEVLSTNTVAFNLYKKLGFVLEGIKRQEVYKDGRYVDSIIMSLLKDEIINSKLYSINN